jgi:hypothetical protein
LFDFGGEEQADQNSEKGDSSLKSVDDIPMELVLILTPISRRVDPLPSLVLPVGVKAIPASPPPSTSSPQEPTVLPATVAKDQKSDDKTVAVKTFTPSPAKVILTFPLASLNFHSFISSTVRVPIHVLYLYPWDVNFDDLPMGFYIYIYIFFVVVVAVG